MWLKKKISNVIFILECVSLVFKGFFEGMTCKSKPKEIPHTPVKDYLSIDEDFRQILEDDINDTLDIVEYKEFKWTRLL